MLWMLIPGVFLGFTMMPWWWLLAAAASLLVGVLFWRSSPPDYERRSALLMAFGSSALAAACYVASVWTAHESCHRPPADGFCMFDGLPFLSLCAVYLLIGVIAWIKWARLRTSLSTN